MLQTGELLSRKRKKIMWLRKYRPDQHYSLEFSEQRSVKLDTQLRRTTLNVKLLQISFTVMVAVELFPF